MTTFWAKILLVVAIVAVGAWLLAPYLPQVPIAVLSSGSRDPITTGVTAIITGLLVAVLVFLIPERWKRIESELLGLRQAQEKALDELRKRADERISEKLDGVARQAQAIRDHVSNLIDRYPWIKAISDADFTPDSCSCQIVLRNAMKFASQNKLGLAHEYLFSWTRSFDNRPRLEGSVYDFSELARFSVYILADEHLGLLMLTEGYRASNRSLLIAPTYLKNLVRHGNMSDASQLAERLRRRAFPTWKEKVRRAWRRSLNFAGPPKRDLAPSVDEYAALALFSSAMGDRIAFVRSIEKAKAAAVTRRESAAVALNESEGVASLGEMERAISIREAVSPEDVRKCRLFYEFAWASRRCGLEKSAEMALKMASREVFVDPVAREIDSSTEDGEGELDDGDLRHEWKEPELALSESFDAAESKLMDRSATLAAEKADAIKRS